MKKDFRNVFVTFSMVGLMLLSSAFLYEGKSTVTAKKQTKTTQSIQATSAKSASAHPVSQITTPTVVSTTTIFYQPSRQSRAS